MTSTQTAVRCLRCGTTAPAGIFSAGPVRLGDGGVITGASGWKMNRRGACYCPGCARSVRFCRECGCTDDAACEGGCSWIRLTALDALSVRIDLCSRCAPIAKFPPVRVCSGCGWSLPETMRVCVNCGEERPGDA